ncbi:hypothetical protein FQA39_LY16503 [Lamprigera yunnana]|nr:hypothetical protein FQA39_LY16503 [Lamprigera yunnana]
MKRFKENTCRICFKYFCCEKCRLRHEVNYHKAFKECDICFYGKIILREPSEKLQLHLKDEHMPLHCLKCEVVFETFDDIMCHRICIMEKNPNREVSTADENYDSPPIGTMHKSIFTSSNKNFSNNANYLTTSTPMQKLNERDLEDIPEIITPVDTKNVLEVITRSVGSSDCIESPIFGDQSSNLHVPIKRKVTFCQTPMVNSSILRKGKTNDTAVIDIDIVTNSNNLPCQNSSNPSEWETALTHQNVTTPQLSSTDVDVNQPLENTVDSDMNDFSEADFLQSSIEWLFQECFTPPEEMKSLNPEIPEESKLDSCYEKENTDPEVSNGVTNTSENTQNSGVWNAVTKAWKNVWKGLSENASDFKMLQKRANKRPQSDIAQEAPQMKPYCYFGGYRLKSEMDAAETYLLPEFIDVEIVRTGSAIRHKERLIGESVNECRMETCFDYSRCHKDFRVYIYPPDDALLPSHSYQKLLGVLEESRYYTNDPNKACLFILSLDTLDRDRLSSDYVRNLQLRIQRLPYWNNGQNHVIFNLYSGTWPDYSENGLDFDPGMSILAKASVSMNNMRPGFDISIPLFHKKHPEKGGEPGFVVSNNFPLNKSYLLAFKGKRYVHGIGSETRNALFHLHNEQDIVMVTTCRHGKSWKDMKDERCDEDNTEYDNIGYDISMVRKSKKSRNKVDGCLQQIPCWLQILIFENITWMWPDLTLMGKMATVDQ